MLRIKSLLAGVLLMMATSLQAMELQEFEAQFTAYKYNRDLGKATLKLSALDGNQYRLTFDSKVSMFLVSDKRREVSLFAYRDGVIVPQSYQFTRTGFGKNRELQATFDGENQQIKLAGKASLPWQQEFDNQLYRLDLQLKLESGEKQFEYDLINYRGEKRHYALQVQGKEQLTLPYGMLEGIKVKIMRENKKRETFAWFAPSLNYQLVRLQQFKEGKEQGDIRLNAFRYLSEVPSAAAK